VPITWSLQDDDTGAFVNAATAPANYLNVNTLNVFGPFPSDQGCPAAVPNGAQPISLLANGTVTAPGNSTFGIAGNQFRFMWDTSPMVDGQQVFNAGCYFFTLKVDSVTQSQTTTSALTLLVFVSDSMPHILTTTLPHGFVGSAYNNTVFEAGGTGALTWSIVVPGTGTLPPGLSIGMNSGIVSGTPNAPGIYNFTAQVTDSLGNFGTQALTLKVADAAFGDLIVANQTPNTPSGTILRVTQAGTTTGTIAAISTGQPSGVAMDATTGNIYAAVVPVNGTGTAGVTQVGPFGAVNSSFVSGGVLQNPAAVAVDGSGNVYVADNKLNAIYEFNSSGTQVNGTAANNAFATLPSSNNVPNHIRMAFDTSGNLGVAGDEFNGKFGVVEVDKTTPTGVSPVAYNTQTNAVLTDALTAVNPPATITNFAIANNVVIFQAVNNFAAGT